MKVGGNIDFIKNIAIKLKNSQESLDIHQDNVIKFIYIKNKDTPCDYIELIFINNNISKSYYELEFYINNNLSFEGIIDKQTLSISADCQMVKISARRKIPALLLDNQARAKTYKNISIQDLYAIHARAYGIQGIEISENRTYPLFSISKGMSEWEVIELFASQVYGVIPYIDEKNYLVIGNRKNIQIHQFSNSQNKLLYSKLEVINSNYNILSHVYICNNDGEETLVYNTGTDPTSNTNYSDNIHRKRFLSNSSEWALFPKWSARDMIQNSIDKSCYLLLELPYIFECNIDDQVVIQDDISIIKNDKFYIYRIEYICEQDPKTKLILYRS